MSTFKFLPCKNNIFVHVDHILLLRVYKSDDPVYWSICVHLDTGDEFYVQNEYKTEEEAIQYITNARLLYG